MKTSYFNVIGGMIMMINLCSPTGAVEYRTFDFFQGLGLDHQNISLGRGTSAPVIERQPAESFHEKSDRMFSVELFPLPILFGEYGIQFEFKVREALNAGINFSYFDPMIGVISNSMIGSFLEPEDAITINARQFTPGISCTHYFKRQFEGFYLGGLLMYKKGIGDILFNDKYSGGLTYRAMIQTDIDISSISFNANTGYRVVLDNGLSFRFGGGLGFQIGSNKTTYTILQEYEAGEGLKSTDDLKDVLNLYYNTVVMPVSYFLSIGIGKIF